MIDALNEKEKVAHSRGAHCDECKRWTRDKWIYKYSMGVNPFGTCSTHNADKKRFHRMDWCQDFEPGEATLP